MGTQPHHVGTSVGALNALFLASHLARHPQAPFMEAALALYNFWETRISSGHQLAKKRGKLQLAAMLITGKWDGLQSMAPLRRIIDEIVAGVDPTTSRIPAFVSVTDLRSGLVSYVPATVECAMASAMMPIVMPPQSIKGEDVYYDGGVREIAPLRLPIDEGCNQLVVLVPSPEHLLPQVDIVLGRVIHRLQKRTREPPHRCQTSLLILRDMRSLPSHRKAAPGGTRGDHTDAPVNGLYTTLPPRIGVT